MEEIEMYASAVIKLALERKLISDCSENPKDTQSECVSVISVTSATSVTGTINTILERALSDNGEYKLLDYLTTDSTIDTFRTNIDYEDTGYQVYILFEAIMRMNPLFCVNQLERYIKWLVEQNNDPIFVWNSCNQHWLQPPSNVIDSPYLKYIRDESKIAMIAAIRKERMKNTLADIKEDIIEHRKYGIFSSSGDSIVSPISIESPEDDNIKLLLLKVAEGVFKSRNPPDGEIIRYKFGTKEAIISSLLYKRFIEANGDLTNIQNIILEYFPCLPPPMNKNVHAEIVKNMIAGFLNTKLLLSSVQQYETTLRDMMEANDLLSLANEYAIGRRHCKKLNPDLQALECQFEPTPDIVMCQELRKKFLSMKHSIAIESLKEKKDKIIIISIKRYIFLLNSHSFLILNGAIDYSDYEDDKRKIRKVHKVLINNYSGRSRKKLVKIVDKASIELTYGIEECFRSLGTEILIPPRLVK